MTVNDLRETLTKLVELLRAADSKAGTVNGLSEFVTLTEGFGELKLKEFVKLAEAGKNPPAPRPPATWGGGGGRQTVSADAVATELADLYARAADPAVTEDQVRAACGKLTALKKEDVVKVAEGVGLEGMKSKKKDDIIAAVTSRLVERKGAAIRGQLIHRPHSAEPEPAHDSPSTAAHPGSDG